jgi:glutamyl-tRNA(Gln) amidotransferase subunit E
MSEELDYKKIGLKCGIEIHRRLDTHKLFCNCKSLMEDKEIDEFVRYLRASKSELGEIDPAALHEFRKGKMFIYRTYMDSTCLVEMDEEPPHEVNREAMEIALEIALLLNTKIVDEVHFMRKIVIDGSNTTGFQRTAIIGTDGFIDTAFGRITIPTVCIEEESAQIIERKENVSVYGINRLCIPLIEISTAPVLDSPEKVKEAALKLGNLLKSTGKVMRGIGSIRQDINISIKGGARVEIKGAQDVNLIPKLVEMEVKRQLALIRIKNELNEKRVSLHVSDVFDLSEVFKNTRCRFLKDKKVLGIKIDSFAGFFKRKLNDFRTLGKEISNYVSAKTKLKGIIHTDEDLEKYGIDGDEIKSMMKKMNAGTNDLIVLVAGKEQEVEEMKTALEVVKERVLLLANGVPEETRRALENGDTEYMRPLPGAARMYPETDIPPIEITHQWVEKVREKLPETLEEKMERFIKVLGLNRELASQVINSEYLYLFEQLAQKYKKVEAKFIASMLVNTIPELKSRENVDISSIKDEWIKQLVEFVESDKIAKDSIYEILKQCINDGESPSTIVEKMNLWKADEEEIRNVVKKFIKEERNVGKLIGMVMKDLRHRADGSEVAKIIKEELSKR